MQKAAKRVGIWIRVSTEDQVKGESPEHHERRAQLYAAAKDWNVVEVYRLDALSGKTVKDYPETRRMLADVKTGHITGLIFSKLARLARNTRELLEFAEIFRDTGADLISLAESIDTSTPAGRLFYTMIAAMAQWEREEIAERVAASVPIRAKMGKPLGGQAPFGYQWVEGKLTPHVDEAPVRALMYELFREHRRKKTVARILNERGYRTRNGSPFSDTTVHRLIEDPTAKGIRRANYTKSSNSAKAWALKPEDQWVLSEVPAIINVELWDECNAVLAKGKGTRPVARKVQHLFSGRAICDCGEKMYVPSNSPKYTCRSCRNKIPVGDLEAIFHEQLRNFFCSGEEVAAHLHSFSTQINQKEDELAILAKEREKVTAQMDRLYELYQAGGIDARGFGSRNKPLQERLEQVDGQLPELQAEVDFLKITHLTHDDLMAHGHDLHTHWPNIPFEDRRRIVETVVESITVGKGDVEINLFYAPPLTGSSGSGPAPPPPSPPDHGNWATKPQGFMAATSWNRAGNSACRAAREIVMRPVSSGSRKASRAARGNSGNLLFGPRRCPKATIGSAFDF